MFWSIPIRSWFVCRSWDFVVDAEAVEHRFDDSFDADRVGVTRWICGSFIWSVIVIPERYFISSREESSS